MAVLLELQARGELRAEDLSERFEVSVRTIYRDLEALSESGVPLAATPGRGYRLMEGYFLPPLAFTATEAALLVMGGEFVRQRVDAELQRPAEDALRKLAGVLPQAQRAVVDQWRHQLLFPRLRTTDDPLLISLRTAIQDQRVVRMRYHAFRRVEPELREIEPFSLVYMSERWQVAAYCRLRQGPRMFRLDRIDDLAVQDEHFALAARHAAPAPTEDWKSTVPLARVRFDPAVERWVRERQLFSLVGEEVDGRGSVFVYAVRDEQALIGWLLSWGAGAEIVDPPALRARMHDEACRIAQRHTPVGHKRQE
jgi:predicted DNA-binding transcriptional regulator YafY